MNIVFLIYKQKTDITKIATIYFSKSTLIFGGEIKKPVKVLTKI